MSWHEAQSVTGCDVVTWRVTEPRHNTRDNTNMSQDTWARVILPLLLTQLTPRGEGCGQGPCTAPTVAPAAHSQSAVCVTRDTKRAVDKHLAADICCANKAIFVQDWTESAPHLMFLTLACYNCDDSVYSQEVGVNMAFVAANISWNFFPRISATSCDPT